MNDFVNLANSNQPFDVQLNRSSSSHKSAFTKKIIQRRKIIRLVLQWLQVMASSIQIEENHRHIVACCCCVSISTGSAGLKERKK